jgi:hypothetical protein
MHIDHFLLLLSHTHGFQFSVQFFQKTDTMKYQNQPFYLCDVEEGSNFSGTESMPIYKCGSSQKTVCRKSLAVC